ncbi:hypothetical protein DKX38_015243 [Salix brachista]|uniref:Uncharacterized protein n=1 Tax=Salix brachista TaxID=2182728 RepID=A0A5N5L520_9ROSI|nr:hypothetical protein DKX38_015243 [Salix brachista]
MFCRAQNGLVLKLLVTYMAYNTAVAVGKWILPGFDQGHQFSGCYLITSGVDATEYSPIICIDKAFSVSPLDFILLVSQVVKKVKQNAGIENFSASMWILLLLAS